MVLTSKGYRGDRRWSPRRKGGPNGSAGISQVGELTSATVRSSATDGRSRAPVADRNAKT
ncbi:hypothetical protein NSERUTF1_2870 [Nocardia seriolae]|nr:hypothetical protein NSERUTF1_2870 [Nocardia seriolae]